MADVDITTGYVSLYQLGSSRYIGWGRVVISSVRWSIYRLIPTRPIGLPMSIYRYRDLLRAITRPACQCRYTGLGMSGYRLGWGWYTDWVRVGIPTHPNPVARLARLGIPTDTHSAYRHCRCLRVMARIAADQTAIKEPAVPLKERTARLLTAKG